MKHVIVVPTYNESEGIRDLLRALEREVPAADVLVVDDASPDGTGQLVRADRRFGRSVFLLERTWDRGLAPAYRAGFRWALERDYEAVVQMDADLSHPPDRIAALLAELDGADVAVGSRYVAGGQVACWTMHRRLLSRVGNRYVRTVLGLRTADVTAGFKAFRASSLLRIDALTSSSSGYAFQIENAWRCERRGLRVHEVPITFTDRVAGSSKMSGGIVREAVLRVLAWRAAELLRVAEITRTAARFGQLRADRSMTDR